MYNVHARQKDRHVKFDYIRAFEESQTTYSDNPSVPSTHYTWAKTRYPDIRVGLFGFEVVIGVICYLLLLCDQKLDPLNGGYPPDSRSGFGVCSIARIARSARLVLEYYSITYIYFLIMEKSLFLL